MVGSSPRGLTSAEAAQRRRRRADHRSEPRALLQAVGRQLDTPITVLWMGGAVLSLVLGAGLDVALIVGTLGVNVLVGAWQERKSDRVAEALRALEARAGARVLRDGRVMEVRASDLVVGDLLLLAPGDRVGADARLSSAEGLEVDESALTGESLPVGKAVDASMEGGRIVLAGSDVVVGRARAIVVAVGDDTRMGATAAALGLQGARRDVLAGRLGQLLREALPISVAGGVLVALAGLARGQRALEQVTVGASVVLAALPEGLPLLAGMGQAAAARRLSRRGVVVRRLAAVEGLGRVDVACVDKTGTLTEARLSVTVIATPDEELRLPMPVTPGVERVLLAAALASPHPDEWSAASHATDMAVIRAAESAGLRGAIRAARTREAAFDPARSFHAAAVRGRLYAKGAPEVLLRRSTRLHRHGRPEPLDDEARAALLRRATTLAARGLRVLLVAEGAGNQEPAEASGLEVLGLVGISDPLRADVADGVARCRQAGIRVVMVTGDHPVTARTIADEAGLLDGEVLTGPELAELENGELDERMERATVIARATPIDKLRIVESLQRRGHTVAMTGDGVNDAPALRLADVGVAMGRSGTEVARQTADVILADDDFLALVDALVEGRGFWGQTRRALGLLLGGNLGELGLMAGATILGADTGLTVRQILAVNLVTDMLPAIAMSVQAPEQRDLRALAREGASALGAPLREDILRRAAATTLPSLAAMSLTAMRDLRRARSVAFASVVSTQLAQILGAGRAEGRLTPSVAGATAVSAVLLGAAFAVPGLRRLLELEMLSAREWGFVAGATALAPLLNRTLAQVGPSSVTGPVQGRRLSVG